MSSPAAGPSGVRSSSGIDAHRQPAATSIASTDGMFSASKNVILLGMSPDCPSGLSSSTTNGASARVGEQAVRPILEDTNPAAAAGHGGQVVGQTEHGEFEPLAVGENHAQRQVGVRQAQVVEEHEQPRQHDPIRVGVFEQAFAAGHLFEQPAAQSSALDGVPGDQALRVAANAGVLQPLQPRPILERPLTKKGGNAQVIGTVVNGGLAQHGAPDGHQVGVAAGQANGPRAADAGADRYVGDASILLRQELRVAHQLGQT